MNSGYAKKFPVPCCAVLIATCAPSFLSKTTGDEMSEIPVKTFVLLFPTVAKTELFNNVPLD